MKFEIVSHCVNYSRFATYQLSSLFLYPPSSAHGVTYTFCYAEDDERARALVTFFSGLQRQNIRWNWVPLPRDRANRRAFGRNAAALATEADWIWFIDADYCLGPGCLDALAAIVSACAGPLVFPRTVRATSHEDGEALIERLEEPRIAHLPFDRFSVEQEFSRAIGGVQIARGEAVRRTGYSPERAHRRAKTWKRPVEDVLFRKTLGTPGVPIDLPEVYRIRHRPWASFDGPPPF
jgi:hypothetical protein